MNALFAFPHFFFLVSVLTALSALRAESTVDRRVSRAAYLVGVFFAALFLAAGWLRAANFVTTDFRSGIALSIVILGGVYAIAQRKFELGMAPAFLSMVCLALGAVGSVQFGASAKLAAQTASHALIGHTFFLFIGLAAFSLSFLFSLLFIGQDYLIRKKIIERLFFELPPLEITSKLVFASFISGTAAFLLGLGGGFLEWHRLRGGARFFADPAVGISCAVLVAYLAVLFLKLGPLGRTRRFAFASLVLYSALITAFLTGHHALRGGWW